MEKVDSVEFFSNNKNKSRDFCIFLMLIVISFVAWIFSILIPVTLSIFLLYIFSDFKMVAVKSILFAEVLRLLYFCFLGNIIGFVFGGINFIYIFIYSLLLANNSFIVDFKVLFCSSIVYFALQNLVIFSIMDYNLFLVMIGCPYVFPPITFTTFAFTWICIAGVSYTIAMKMVMNKIEKVFSGVFQTTEKITLCVQ